MNFARAANREGYSLLLFRFRIVNDFRRPAPDGDTSIGHFLHTVIVRYGQEGGQAHYWWHRTTHGLPGNSEDIPVVTVGCLPEVSNEIGNLISKLLTHRMGPNFEALSRNCAIIKMDDERPWVGWCQLIGGKLL